MTESYRIVLFLHVLALLVLVGAIAIVGLSYTRLRSAQSREDALPWATLAGRTGWLFPVAVLGLFASGAFLTSDSWTWGTHWIDVSIVGLVLVAAQGPLVAGPRAKALDVALRESSTGELGEDVRRLARAPALWFVVCGNPALVLAIVWNMTFKPGTAGAVAALAVGYLVAAVAAVRLR